MKPILKLLKQNIRQAVDVFKFEVEPTFLKLHVWETATYGGLQSRQMVKQSIQSFKAGWI
jgi:hypothetical protein